MNTDSMKKAVEAGCVAWAELGGYKWPEDYDAEELASNRRVFKDLLDAALPHLGEPVVWIPKYQLEQAKYRATVENLATVAAAGHLFAVNPGEKDVVALLRRPAAERD